MVDPFAISGRPIGPDQPMYVIAELSANHGRVYERAVKLIQAARKAGADAVKLQTYTADTLTINCDKPSFRIGAGTLWSGRLLYDLYQEAALPWDWHEKLQQVARDEGIHLFSTAYDSTAVDFLESLNMPAYKVASFEVIDIPLLERVGKTAKPVILSTGMATLAEIDEAVRTLRDAGAGGLALLKCSSAYPSPPEAMNLRAIQHLSQSFNVPAGLSDHTLGGAVPIAAVALGACILEKHLTLERSLGGPDAAFSLEPDEFASMTLAIRQAQNALGQVRYGPTSDEMASTAFRRSLFVVEDMREGEAFTHRNVRSIRPAKGLHPRHLRNILGKRATRDIERGTPLQWDLVASQGSGKKTNVESPRLDPLS